LTYIRSKQKPLRQSNSVNDVFPSISYNHPHRQVEAHSILQQVWFPIHLQRKKQGLWISRTPGTNSLVALVPEQSAFRLCVFLTVPVLDGLSLLFQFVVY